MTEQETIVLGIVSIKNMGEYNSQTDYEKLNVVTYNGSSYCALQNCKGIAPTNTEYWQLYAEKGDQGDTGPQGPKPVKGTDYYTADDIAELETTLASDVSDEVTEQLSNLTSVTPLVASSTAGMTDTTRIYVNSTDGHWYWHDGTDWQDGGVYQATQIADESIDFNQLSQNLQNHIKTEDSENIIQLELTVGHMKSTIEEIYDSPYYQYGKGIVSGKQRIKFTGISGANVIYPAILFYNSNDELIGSAYGTGTQTPYHDVELTTPRNTAYVIINGTTSQTAYPKLSILSQVPIREFIDNVNPLIGKKIICNGDSIIRGQGYDGTTQGNRSFINDIADSNRMTITNYAVSGATISNGINPDVHHICEDIDNMSLDTDYVIIGGGYNDYNYNIPIGEISADYTSELETDRTVIGGTEKMCRKLLSRYKGKKIGFVFTHKIKQAPYTKNQAWSGETYTLTECFEEIKKVLNKYSIPYCDIYNDSTFNTAMSEYLQYTANNDGTHPTELGYKTFYNDKFEHFLKSL